MQLHVSLSGRADLSGQLYRQIRSAIEDGLIRAGEAMPSTRELAQQLNVSRGTVTVTYDRLVAEGHLRSRAGAGTFVSAVASAQPPRSLAGSPLRPRPVWDGIDEGPDMSRLSPEFDFRCGIPDQSLFPYATWRALMADQLRPSAVGSGSHIGAAGHPGLRAAIARHIGVSRSVQAAPEDVFVTSGSQQAIDLVARVLLEPGDLVAVEDPGYPPPRGAFVSSGCRVVGVPVDAEGLVVDAVPAEARLVYVTPSHQFPLGTVMSLSRRRQLLDWAERADAVIVEDDYDSEFRYGGRPLEPLHRLDHTGRVLYVGSFSKVLLPTLRLGFVVAPTPLHSALRKAKHVADWHTSVPIQAATARFIESGHLARHVRRMRGVYAARRDAVRSGLADSLADHLEVLPSAAGLHVTATFRAPRDDRRITRGALSDGLAVQPLSLFGLAEPGPPGVMIGFGAIGAERIPEGLRRLRAAIERSEG
ncbi:MAG TPA: PLP-dependent aminotransferase family protein [Pseudonocardia sp.]|nr:PLP-dependent aminotransferase family protein [Pseudonocardia sp.]